MYLDLLADVGFESIKVAGPTDFRTSPSTLGFDFSAVKPLASKRPSRSRATALVTFVAVATAVVAVVAMRRRA